MEKPNWARGNAEKSGLPFVDLRAVREDLKLRRRKSPKGSRPESRESLMRSLGMVKVRGALGGVYYE